MPPRHELPVDIGFGGEVTLTASQEKAVRTLIAELTKMKKELEAIRRVKKELKAINKIEKDTEEELSRHYKDKKDALLLIRNVYKKIIADKKAQNKETEEEISLYDLLRKRESWELMYFTSVASAIGLASANSKVLGHYFDIVGSALGFVMDMLLIPLIPLIIKVVDILFRFGEFLQTLPAPLRDVLGIITLIGLGLMGLYSKEILEGIALLLLKLSGLDKYIGAKIPAPTPTPTPAPAPVPAPAGAVPVPLTEAVIPAGEVGGTVGLTTTVGLLAGAAFLYHQILTNAEGVNKTFQDIGTALYAIGTGGAPLTDEQKSRLSLANMQDIGMGRWTPETGAGSTQVNVTLELKGDELKKLVKAEVNTTQRQSERKMSVQGSPY